MLSWMFEHDYLDTYCFECLICMCFVFRPVQRNGACFTWKGALEIHSLLLLLNTPSLSPLTPESKPLTSNSSSQRHPHDRGQGGGCSQHAQSHSGRFIVQEVAHGPHVAQQHTQVHGMAARQEQRLRFQKPCRMVSILLSIFQYSGQDFRFRYNLGLNLEPLMSFYLLQSSNSAVYQ